MKKVLSLVLSLVMLLSITAGIDLSAYADISGDFEYELLDDGTAEITNYIGKSDNVVIPEKLDGYLVTAIANYSFYDARQEYAVKIKNVTIPYSVTSVYAAFNGCSELTSINVDVNNEYLCSLEGVLFSKDMTQLIQYPVGNDRTKYEIPDSVVEISGYGAFQDCESLAEIIIPDSVLEIDNNSFMGCKNLSSVNLPSNLICINDGVFQDCTSLKRIELPDTLCQISRRAFANSGLESITIPSEVGYIGSYAFNECLNLTIIIVDENNQDYSSLDGVLFNKDRTSLIQYPIGNIGTSYIVPNTVTNISDVSFEYCTNLNEVRLLEGVISIGSFAFGECENLASITIPDSVTNIDAGAFFGTPYYYNKSNWENDTLYINNALIASKKSENYFVKDNTIVIADWAFWCNDDIQNVIIPDSMISIGEGAFADCDDLYSIVVLNPNCNIHKDEYEQGDRTISEITVIYGYTNSTAQEYAEKYNRTFVALDDYNCEENNHCYFFVDKTEATCTENGFAEYKCVLCEKIYSEEIPAHHNYVNGFCTICRERDPDYVIPSISLDETQAVNIENGGDYVYFTFTPEADGEYEFYSTGDYDTYGYLYDEEMNELASNDDNGIDSNFLISYYFEKGKTYIFACRLYSSSKTGIFDVSVKAVEEHQHNYMSVVTVPTCTKQGYTTYTCECGESYVDNYVPAAGHTVVTDKAVTATCTTAGKTAGSHCSVCGTVITSQKTVAATGHSWNSGAVTKKATCTSTGVKTYTCTKCKATKTSSIAKIAHTYKTTTTKATTKKNGSIVTKCSVCGAKKSSTAIPYVKSLTLSATSYVYNGKVRTPSVTVKDSKGKTLKKNTDYTVTYAKGRKAVGTYTVTIKFKGNYSGTVKKTFTIKPKATSISKLTAKSKGFTVKWKKLTTQTTGYQIQYSTSSKFTSKTTKTVTVSKNKTTSKTISKLKSKKKYYVRIRTYKTINGKMIYSAWSKAKTVTTKK